MKIIFLDVDGVLNSQDTFINNRKHWEKTKEHLGDVDEEMVRFLSMIIQETQAKVVMSSSWRGFIKAYLSGKEDLRDNKDALTLCNLFNKYNIEIYDYTGKRGGEYEDGTWKDRGQEVRDWLFAHEEVRQFVILDDDNFPDWFWLKQFWVKTSFYETGLTYKHAQRAIKILNQ